MPGTAPDGNASVSKMDQDLVSQTRRTYDIVAANYARMLPDTSHEAPLDLAMIDHFVSQLATDASVLDAGCGAGRMLAHLSALNPSLRLKGVDLSPAMVAEARTAHPGLQITVGELADLDYPNAEFDGVLAWYSVIHTPPHEIEAVLREFYRVLRPGGVLLAGFQSGAGERSSTRAYGHDVDLRAFLHPVQDVAAAAEAVGFRVLTRLERAPREGERHPQGFVIVVR